MAYTTQKDVFKIGFLNQPLDPTCARKTAVALKTYASTTDVRALDSRRLKQAQFLTDLVACRTYSGDQNIPVSGTYEIRSGPRTGGQGDYSDDDLSENILSDLECIKMKCHSNHTNCMMALADSYDLLNLPYSHQSNITSKDIGLAVKHVFELVTKFGNWAKQAMNIPDTDSLLFRTTEKLTDFETLLKENEKLKEELVCSANELKKLNDENVKIKEILINGDPSKIVEFENKIDSLRKMGRIDENDIEELLKLRKQIGDRQKAIEILEAENSALKNLTEKLSTRSKIPEIIIEKETSTDIPYLQDKINNLKQEIGILRTMEDEFTKLKINYNSMKQKYDDMTEQQKQNFISKDTNRVKAIIDERNRLRGQLEKMIGMEGKIAMLREKAMKADQLEKELEEYRSSSQFALQTLQDCKQKIENLDRIMAENAALKTQLESGNSKNIEKICSYEKRINDLNEQIRQTTCILQRSENENCCLRQRLQCSAEKIADYEEQMHQLMMLVHELQNVIRSKMHEMQTFDSSKHELISTSKTCLQQIRKELELRSNLENELRKCKKDLESLRTFYKQEKDQRRIKYDELIKKIDDVTYDAAIPTTTTTPTSTPKQPSEIGSQFISQQYASYSMERFEPPSHSNLKLKEKSEDQQPMVSKEFSMDRSEITRGRKVKGSESLVASSENRLVKRESSLEESGIEHSEPDDLVYKLQTDLNECRRTVIDFENKIQNLEQELKWCKYENDKLKEKNELLSLSAGPENYDNHIEELADLRAILKKERDECDVQAREFEELKREYSDLKRQLDVKSKFSFQDKTMIPVVDDSDYERLKVELENKNRLLYDAKNELERCRKEITEFKSLSENYKKQLGDKDDAIKTIRSSLSFKSELEDCRKELSRYVDQVRDLQREIDDCKSLNEKYKKELEDKDDEIKTVQSNNFKSELEDCRKELSRYVDQVRDLQREIDDCKSLNEKYKKQLEDKDDEIKTVQSNNFKSELNDCRKELSRYVDQVRDLQREIDDCKSLNEKYKKQLEDKDDEIKTVQSNNFKSELNDCRKELSRYVDQVRDLQREIDDCKSLNEKYKKQLEDKDDEIKTVQSNNFKSELEDCRKELSRYVERVRDLQKEIDECKSLNEKYRKELDEKDDDVRRTRSRFSDLEKRLQNALEESDKKESECDKLKRALKETEENLKKLQEKVSSIDSENKRLKDSIAEKEKEVNNLKEQIQKNKVESDKLQSGSVIQLETMKIEKERLNAQLIDKEGEIIRLNNIISKKDSEIKDLRAENERLNEELSKKEIELKILANEKDRIQKQLTDKNVDIDNIKDEKDRLNERLIRVTMDMNSLRSERDELFEQIDKKEEEIRDLKNLVDRLKDDVRNLKSELETCKKEKVELSEIIGEIEKEQDKNKNLDKMLQRFENKIDEAPKSLPLKKVGSSAEANLQSAIDKLRQQLENEKVKNDELRNELKECKDKLQTVQAKKVDTSGKSSGGPAPDVGAASLFSGVIDMESIRITVEKALDNLKIEHIASLRRLQDMHEKQLKDLTTGHDKEIDALRKANQAMRNSLSNIRQKMETNACTCDKRAVGRRDDVLLTKLQCICKKILDGGIECLSLSELTYLHTEVYKAGFKLRPEILKCVNISSIPKCCKCSGFACCLPSLPPEKEKFFVERIVNLEKDVDNANKVLQFLKMHCDNKTHSSPTTSAGSRGRNQSFRPNDEINKLLKKVSEGKMSTNRRSASKRKNT